MSGDESEVGMVTDEGRQFARVGRFATMTEEENATTSGSGLAGFALDGRRNWLGDNVDGVGVQDLTIKKDNGGSR